MVNLARTVMLHGHGYLSVCEYEYEGMDGYGGRLSVGVAAPDRCGYKCRSSYPVCPLYSDIAQSILKDTIRIGDGTPKCIYRYNH